MSIPDYVKPGDFYLVSFDGKNPNLSDPRKWALSGGLIRLGQWANREGFGPYEHAGIYIGNSTVVEAANTGTVLQGWHYDRNEVRWSSNVIPLTSAQRFDIVAAARGYVGTPYSWPDYAAIAAHTLHLLPATDALKDYVASSKHMICSQVVDQCYQDAGVHLFHDNRWPGYVTPASLNNRLDGRVT